MTRVKPGDHAVFTVRRGCDQCLPCGMNRSDICRTGHYHERGIWGLDGYQTEFVVDREQYVVRVPTKVASFAVLTEPLTIAEKAIDEAVRVQQARLPDAPAAPDWLFGRRCLVAGLGLVGLLAAAALRLCGAVVFGLDVVDADTARPRWLAAVGGQYMDRRKVDPGHVEPTIDLIFEATGVARLEFDLLESLAPDGVYVLTGIPGGERPLQIPGTQLVRELVLDNQVMLGGVNAARGHFQMAVDDLAAAQRCWPGQIERLITNRVPYTDFESALRQHPPQEIKTVIEWAPGT